VSTTVSVLFNNGTRIRSIGQAVVFVATLEQKSKA